MFLPIVWSVLSSFYIFFHMALFCFRVGFFYWIFYLLTFLFFLFSNFLLGIFFIYISNAIPKVPHTLSSILPPLLSPPIPTSWPWCSPVLRHIKFAIPRGLSSQCSQRHKLWGYWLVHIVVLPIGLQTPSAPWVLSLAALLGAPCSIQQMTVSIHFCICQTLASPHKRQLYQGPFSKILLAYAIVSGFGG